MPSDYCLHQVIQALLGFQIFEVDLAAPATNLISEPFPWVVLNRLRKTFLALQCIRKGACKTAFFIKVRLFSKTVN